MAIHPKESREELSFADFLQYATDAISRVGSARLGHTPSFFKYYEITESAYKKKWHVFSLTKDEIKKFLETIRELFSEYKQYSYEFSYPVEEALEALKNDKDLFDVRFMYMRIQKGERRRRRRQLKNKR